MLIYLRILPSFTHSKNIATLSQQCQSVLRIQDIYNGSRIRFFPSPILDPGLTSSRIRIRIKMKIILTQKLFLGFRKKMIWHVHPGSRIRILFPSRIQGSKKYRIPDPQHWCQSTLFYPSRQRPRLTGGRKHRRCITASGS
jgi:hypothetical protein